MHPPLLHLADYLGPLAGAAVFVCVRSAVREPGRRTFNALLVTGASGVYLSGGFGLWELVYPAAALWLCYRGLTDYRFIAIAWLCHSTWDVAHHFYGNAIWPFMPTSSFGCMIFDGAIALWFFAGAPSVLEGIAARLRRSGSRSGASP